MWTSRLFWKLFLVYGGLNFVLAAMFPLLLAQWQAFLLREQESKRLEGMAVLLRSQVAEDVLAEDYESLNQLARRLAREADVRITLITADGVVLADSDEDASRMQNHSNREELIQAATAGRGSMVRRSPTLGLRMLYSAVPVQRDGELVAFVRLAVNWDSLHTQIQQRQRVLWMVAIGVALLAAPVTYLIARSITRPLAALTASARAIRGGDYHRPVALPSRGEVGELAAAFNQMRVELARRVAQLEDSNLQMATVLGGMVEGVLAVDAQRRVLLANRACRTLMGITSGDVVGRTLLEVVRNVEIDEAVTQAMTSNEPHQREFNLIGPPRRVLSVFTARLTTGPTPGSVVVLHDITELRRLESLRREFVANVSHELKTPLASIKAYAETLRMGAVNDPAHNLGFVERISEQAEMLHRLIMDLLHLARIEAGQEALQFGRVDIEPLVAKCIAQVQQLADQKQITINVIPPADVLAVWADLDGMLTMLNNLVGNAVKYTPDKGQVEIRWDRDHNELVLEVEDTGIGIASEDQERIFERFYRVHKARSRDLGGTGLGLAIVKHLTQSFGGSVSLRSEVNVGSVFCIRLPRAQE